MTWRKELYHGGFIALLRISNLSPYFPEKAMAPHSSTLALKIPWTETPGRLQSMGSQRVKHDWNNLACMYKGPSKAGVLSIFIKPPRDLEQFCGWDLNSLSLITNAKKKYVTPSATKITLWIYLYLEVCTPRRQNEGIKLLKLISIVSCFLSPMLMIF